MKPEIANLAESFEAAMEASDSRYFGIRIECEPRTVGEILSNSWHPASECDWVEEDTELDGACCFEVQGSVSAAIRAALSYWPNPNGISLIGGQEKGDPARQTVNALILETGSNKLLPHEFRSFRAQARANGYSVRKFCPQIISAEHLAQLLGA